ncbi:zinc-binding dehydrogenase [Pseudofrankia asymbiotica]|uniref:Alcohol dehydrogenase n=1 Tax=Pseudofrankia asymbiotica TaxID=1834516 RepID=A0A1V2I4A9_9ACTN|nr:zinc-binding dehydrogenase [Pseudofrankia asymbiotica]ONH25394.1 alcohol dehydrogenase [Pseudofrankia asymbiotica]
MWALVSDGYGSVRLDEVDDPDPGPSEIVIGVTAFSVNRGETLQLEAPAPGWRPGKDIAGRVLAAADGFGPPAGTAVVAHVPSSGWAQRVAVAHTTVVELPAQVDATTAAALPLAGLTALRLLRRVGPLPGISILITGASGGVGHYVTELAVAAGAEVTAVSASLERGGRLATLGANVVTDVEQAQGRFDVVLDSVGGPGFTAARRKAYPAGRVLWFGQASRQPISVDFFDWIDGTAGAAIEQFHYAGTPEADAADLRTLVRLVHRGQLRPEIGVVDSWTRTAHVIEDLRARRIRGNAILTVE